MNKVSPWKMSQVLVILVALACLVAGFEAGHATRKYQETFSWVYSAHWDGDPRMTGQNVILFGTHGRTWTGLIRLTSCKQYQPGRGYPPCPKDQRVPDFYK